MQGKLYARMHDVFEQLFDQEFLQDAGFLTTRTQNITGWTDEEIQHEDAFATLAGRFATRYCMNGARRTLYLWGYPHNVTLTLSFGQGIQPQIVDSFLVAKDLWLK